MRALFGKQEKIDEVEKFTVHNFEGDYPEVGERIVVNGVIRVIKSVKIIGKVVEFELV